MNGKDCRTHDRAAPATVMKRTLTIIGFLLLAWATVEIALLARSLRTATENANELIIDTREGLSGTLELTDATLNRIVAATDTWERGSRQTARDSTRATKAAADTLEGVQRAVSRIENELIPQATNTLAAGEGTIKALEGNMSDLNSRLAPTLENLATASQEASERLADPSIAASVANVEKLTGEAAGVATEAHATAVIVKEATARATKPGSLIWKGIKFGLDTAWKLITSIRGL